MRECCGSWRCRRLPEAWPGDFIWGGLQGRRRPGCPGPQGDWSRDLGFEGCWWRPRWRCVAWHCLLGDDKHFRCV